MSRLEHLNMTVPDIDAAIRFIKLAAPDFTIRIDSTAEQGYRWVHIGDGESYLALQATHVGSKPLPARETYVNYGINHAGLIIDDAFSVEAALQAAGYRQNGPMLRDTHRLRLYFYDEAGFEWELVEYLTDDPVDRHLYE